MYLYRARAIATQDSKRRRAQRRSDMPQPPFSWTERLENRLLLSTYPLSSVPALSSDPAAPATLYLDFVGDPNTHSTPAYDLDGDPTTFSDAELANIREIWARVAEKFSPFNLNVTTVDPGPPTPLRVLRVLVGGNGSWYSGGEWGTSYIDEFQVNDNLNTIWVFSANIGSPRLVAEVAAHEAGHGFGLYHQSSYSGTTQTSEYNFGNSLVAPIMGCSSNSGRGVWWYGPSEFGSTSMQDDLARITRPANGFGYRPDDHGNTAATADPLAVSGTSVSASGIIEQMTDADYFSFTTPAGQVTINVNVAQYGPTLHAQLELHDASDNVVATAADPSTLGQTITTNVPAGTYYVVVQSYGQYGDLGQYTVSGTIPAASSSPAPVANAGGPYTVTEGGSVALSGLASTGSNLTYAWDFNGNGIYGETSTANGNETGAAPVFQPGTLHSSTTVSLRVTDDRGRTSTSVAAINITNVPPTASITGAPASSPEGTALSLTSNVSDPGPGDTFSYAWSVTKNGGAYAAGTGAVYSFTPNDNGTYVVSVNVTDRDGGLGTASKTITVTNVAPTASILGAPATSPEGSAINVTAGVSDPGTLDTFTYAWSVSKNGSAFASGTGSSLTFTPNDNATYAVNLTVTDKDGGVGTASRTITATNVAPTAYIAGAPVSSAEGSPINLLGSATDPGTLDTITYAWSVARNGLAYGAAAGANLTLTPNDSGTFVVTLSATDKDGGVGTTSRTINVTNIAPTAIISGAPGSGKEGTAISLTGSATDPGSANTFTYAWSVTRNGSAFAAGGSANFAFTPARSGTYAATLTVTDDGGAVGTATASISVTNVAPTVAIDLLSQSSTVSFSSTVSDPGPGDAFTYAWYVTKNGTAFASGSGSTFSFTPDAAGTYQTSLAVTDLDGATTTASRTITVATYDPVITDASPGDQYYLRLDAAQTNLELYAGTSASGALVFSSPAANLRSLTLNGGGGGDQLIIDLANGNPVPTAGLFYSSANGSLQVVGSGVEAATYAPSGTTLGNGTLSIGASPINLAGIQSLALSGLASLALTTPNTDDNIAIDSPAADIARIAGTSDSIGIAPIQFSQIGSLALILGGGVDAVDLRDVSVTCQIVSGPDVSLSTHGAAVVTLTGSLSVSSLSLNDSSRLDIAPASASVLRTSGLAIGAGATLDINDNLLIVQSSAANSSADLHALQALAASGRNEGTWNGNGIISSNAAADTRHLTGVATILNQADDGSALFNTFAGQAVDNECIIVKNALNGDMNLDGVVNFDDYYRMNQGYLSNGVDHGYRNGDLNYDGKIDFDDYFLINRAMLGQGDGMLQSQPLSVAAPPVTPSRPSQLPKKSLGQAHKRNAELSRRHVTVRRDHRTSSRR